MSIANRLTGNPTVNRPRCLLGYWLEEADDPDVRRALALATDRKTKIKWSAEALAAEMCGNGMNVSASTIRNHRRRMCACTRREDAQ